MARIARTLTALLAFAIFTVMGATAASACAVPTSTSVTVPAWSADYAFTGTDGDMVATADDCVAAVTTTTDGTVVFRDYGTDTTTGALVPLTTCEGEDGPRFLSIDLAPTADDVDTYVIGARV